MKKCRCIKCGLEWVPRIENPRVCPHCKSYLWNGKKGKFFTYRKIRKTLKTLTVAKIFYAIRKPKYLGNYLFNLFDLKFRIIDLQCIVLYVTSSCNLKCLMCDIGQQNNKGIEE